MRRKNKALFKHFLFYLACRPGILAHVTTKTCLSIIYPRLSVYLFLCLCLPYLPVCPLTFLVSLSVFVSLLVFVRLSVSLSASVCAPCFPACLSTSCLLIYLYTPCISVYSRSCLSTCRPCFCRHSCYLFPPLVSVARSSLQVNPLEEDPQGPLSYLAVINGRQVTPSPCVDY